jgi:hypothetical protein
MSHIAMQEAVDGNAVDWMEKVSDAQYSGAGPAEKLNPPPNGMPLPTDLLASMRA